jgi:epoxyqueuosine reductase QueG
MDPISALKADLSAVGLNLAGVAAASDWDREAQPAQCVAEVLPEARSILVFGSGGRALWDHLLVDLKAHPDHLTGEAHPLDAFVRRHVALADARHLTGRARRWCFAAAEADKHVDFRLLAHLAGLGARSRLGLLLHPTWGPWLGLRAACFLDAALPPSPPGGPDLCEGCPAPCLAACPGGAFPDGTWDVDACGAYHVASGECRSTCHARVACPVGAAHRYPPEELAYHAHRNSGRAWLRRELGIPDGADPFEGDGPYWETWRTRVASRA